MTTTQQDSSRASSMYCYISDEDHDDLEDNSDVNDSEEEKLEENDEDKVVGCWPNGVTLNSGVRCGSRRAGWSLGEVFDPRAKWVQEWKRVFLLVCAVGLFVDPLFYYALSVSDTCMCLFVDGWFALTVTALRCMTDAVHVWNMLLKLKMTKRSFGLGAGSGLIDTNSRSAAHHYLKAEKGFLFDLFVILPLPQKKNKGQQNMLQ